MISLPSFGLSGKTHSSARLVGSMAGPWRPIDESIRFGKRDSQTKKAAGAKLVVEKVPRQEVAAKTPAQKTMGPEYTAAAQLKDLDASRQEQLAGLLQGLGLGQTKRPALYHLALLHPSYNRMLSRTRGMDAALRACAMQRLEFLGDRVLEVLLWRSLLTLPNFKEYRGSSLEQLRHKAASNERLHGLVVKSVPGFPTALLYGGSEDASERDKPFYLADALEALLGAAYLDGKMTGLRGMLEDESLLFFACYLHKIDAGLRSGALPLKYKKQVSEYGIDPEDTGLQAKALPPDFVRLMQSRQAGLQKWMRQWHLGEMGSPAQELYRQALVDSSYTTEAGISRSHNNTRLKHLGNAVLSLLVTEYLMRRFPDYSSSELDFQRKMLLQEPLMSGLARHLGFGELVVHCPQSKKFAGVQQVPLYAFQATLGALYLDGKFNRLQTFLYGQLDDLYAAGWPENCPYPPPPRYKDVLRSALPLPASSQPVSNSPSAKPAGGNSDMSKAVGALGERHRRVVEDARNQRCKQHGNAILWQRLMQGEEPAKGVWERIIEEMQR